MKNNDNEYWDLMQTFAQVDEAQNPELETPKWQAKQDKIKKAEYADEARKASVLDTDYLTELLPRYGFHPQTMKGGDLDAMKSDLATKISGHGFKDDKHKQTAMKIINGAQDAQSLWMGMFNWMRAATNPTEKLGSTKISTKR